MKIGVLTSGGDSPGMNAAIRAVVRTALYHGCEVFGIKRGYSGLLSGEIIPLDSRAVGDILQRGGTILQSARCPAFKTAEGQALAKEQLLKMGLNALVIIGGDGSFRGAQDLNKMGFQTVGLPGTIDNDIGCTDYTIGFDTAVNTVLDAVNKIRDTASSHNRVYIVEVMGKLSGFIAAAAGLTGGAESVLVPEIPADLNALCAKISRSLHEGKTHSIVLVAEGFYGDPVDADQSSAFKVGRFVAQHTGCETRITVLGHIQRGGTPTFFDRKIATLMGAKAVELILAGETEKMVGIVNDKIEAFDMDAAIGERKQVDPQWLDLIRILS
ncbi:6-phosphofructokinase [Hydrogenispora ethanolica]|uniref:ATP-dependent 6-phosphofructokinase n=1 Tax=Hydrogenispora ethanolica TaxID=1082276 RepID=A0A4R1R770_HYDET|nr:6-phosphofructokinase [Hydrogenispora ethanolica]TCL61453.1 6-phosphofructokinase [Hydrogenispora ethanolica]